MYNKKELIEIYKRIRLNPTMKAEKAYNLAKDIAIFNLAYWH